MTVAGRAITKPLSKKQGATLKRVVRMRISALRQVITKPFRALTMRNGNDGSHPPTLH